MLSHFHLIPERDGQTEGQTDKIAISISHISMLTRNNEATNLLSTYLLSCGLNVAERLRDTLVHELCHAMVWIEHKVIDGHGNFWKYWYS